MQIADLIRERGPITVAAFMDLALYDPEVGYYARAPRRSGRTGDFFTSVDVGALFGELLEVQLAEMGAILHSKFSIPHFDLVEAGAGNGRLAADILRAARRRDPAFFERVHLHLVEASAAARAEHPSTLGDVGDRLVSSTSSLPSSFEGVLVANELLDALPVHQVVMRTDGLREVYVSAGACGPREAPGPPTRQPRWGGPPEGSEAKPSRRARASESLQPGALGVGSQRDEKCGAPRAVRNDDLVLVEGPLSTPELAAYLERLGVDLEPGWRVEINLRAVEWVRDAARRLRRGFMILVDYGHEARELYSTSHSAGTLTTFSGHTMAGPESAPAWTLRPGKQDITAHVDFTSVRAAAEEEGLTTLGFLDQTYFLLGITQGSRGSHGSRGSNLENLVNIEKPENFENFEDLKKRLALKTLLMPGGLGSTHKVLIVGNGVGAPSLAGCSYRMRVT